jgi:hypothetical protein
VESPDRVKMLAETSGLSDFREPERTEDALDEARPDTRDAKLAVASRIGTLRVQASRSR